MLTPVPLLIIPFALYNIVAFLTPGLEWTSILWQISLPSGAIWEISAAKAFIAFSLLFLLFEILKSARVHARSFIDHSLSALIMLVALAEFLLVPQAGTSTFALLLCIMLLDVVAGITAAIRAPRRARAAKVRPAPAPAPVVQPAPAPAPSAPTTVTPAQEPKPVATPAPAKAAPQAEEAPQVPAAETPAANNASEVVATPSASAPPASTDNKA